MKSFVCLLLCALLLSLAACAPAEAPPSGQSQSASSAPAQGQPPPQAPEQPGELRSLMNNTYSTTRVQPGDDGFYYLSTAIVPEESVDYNVVAENHLYYSDFATMQTTPCQVPGYEEGQDTGNTIYPPPGLVPTYENRYVAEMDTSHLFTVEGRLYSVVYDRAELFDFEAGQRVLVGAPVNDVPEGATAAELLADQSAEYFNFEQLAYDDLYAYVLVRGNGLNAWPEKDEDGNGMNQIWRIALPKDADEPTRQEAVCALSRKDYPFAVAGSEILFVRPVYVQQGTAAPAGGEETELRDPEVLEGYVFTAVDMYTGQARQASSFKAEDNGESIGNIYAGTALYHEGHIYFWQQFVEGGISVLQLNGLDLATGEVRELTEWLPPHQPGEQPPASFVPFGVWDGKLVTEVFNANGNSLGTYGISLAEDTAQRITLTLPGFPDEFTPPPAGEWEEYYIVLYEYLKAGVYDWDEEGALQEMEGTLFDNYVGFAGVMPLYALIKKDDYWAGNPRFIPFALVE